MDCVHAAVVDGGLFVFDLYTRHALERWDQTAVFKTDDELVVMSGRFDGAGARAVTEVRGLVKDAAGCWTSFHEEL